MRPGSTLVTAPAAREPCRRRDRGAGGLYFYLSGMLTARRSPGSPNRSLPDQAIRKTGIDQAVKEPPEGRKLPPKTVPKWHEISRAPATRPNSATFGKNRPSKQYHSSNLTDNKPTFLDLVLFSINKKYV